MRALSMRYREYAGLNNRTRDNSVVRLDDGIPDREADMRWFGLCTFREEVAEEG